MQVQVVQVMHVVQVQVVQVHVQVVQVQVQVVQVMVQMQVV